MAHCCIRHARHLHGGAGHGHRLGRAALHRRLALRHYRRSHLGADQLSRRQCHHSPRQQLVLSALRAQTLFADLRCHLHRQFLCLRSSADAGHHAAGPGGTRGRRRRTAAALAIHPAGIFSASPARSSYGRLRLRRSSRSRPRPHARGLAHGHLLLALRLLHQHPHRPAGHVDDQCLRA